MKNMYQMDEQIEESVENTEQTAEQNQEALFSEEEVDRRVNDTVNKIIGPKLARREAKVSQKYEAELAKHRELESIIMAGTGANDLDEAIATTRKFYEGEGIPIPQQKSERSLRRDEEEILANHEADLIIQAGFEEVVDETNRLASKGDNMTDREKAIFKNLANYRKSEEDKKELLELGVDLKEFDQEGFKKFAGQFKDDANIKDIYKLYTQNGQTKEKPANPGSMKDINQKTGAKEFYTSEEVDRLTSEDLDDPLVMAAVMNSMAKWK